MLTLFAWTATLSAQKITREKADEIVLNRMNQETSVYYNYYTIYNKENVQTEMAITTINGEVFELDYPCWVYYINYSYGIDANRYLIINESNGNLLEIKAKKDTGPADLATWRIGMINYYADAKQLYYGEIIKNENHPNYNNPELDEEGIKEILEIIQAVYDSQSLERDTVFYKYKIHEYYRYNFHSVELEVNPELPAIQNLSQGIIPTGDETLDKILSAYAFDSVETFVYPKFPWITISTKKEYNLIPIVKEFNELESIISAEFAIERMAGDGNRIELIREGDSATITFSIGRGDCPSGCIYRKHWEFQVSDGVAKFIKTY